VPSLAAAKIAGGIMSKLVYGVLGASALVAVVSLASRVIEAQTLSGSSGISSSCSSGFCPPADCSNAAASSPVIWPPDHKMVPETITGVTNATTIMVTLIKQDEPVETPGSGNTEPDGSGVGTSTAYVRAERAGPGTGRIYFISFTGTDAIGGQCIGKVQVCVPHDQGQGSTCIDTGQLYDSTVLVD
jgi:hypothetical protein